MERRYTFLLVIVVLFLLFLFGCSSSGDTPSPSDSDKLKVFFLNVGKGDAALIGIPGGYWVMIDTGPEEGFPEIGRQLVLNGIKNLSAVFLSHGHSDHTGGLPGVLSTVSCDKLYTNSDAMTDIKDGLDSAGESGTQVNVMALGQEVVIGEAKITSLGPVGNYSDENDRSIVLMLQYKDTNILFAADQLSEAESGLLGSGSGLKADVLKVAHHGASDSTSAAFLKAVGPRYAIITTDTQDPPSRQVLDEIALEGAKCFVLGDTGTVLLASDGKDTGISELKPDGSVPDVRINALDSSSEYVVIGNHSTQEVDLTGWCICSFKAFDTYFFPSGTKILAGGSIKVCSAKEAEKGSGLIWTTEKIWSKDEECVLYDAYGRKADSMQP
jgi:competence protein ComEC